MWLELSIWNLSARNAGGCRSSGWLIDWSDIACDDGVWSASGRIDRNTRLRLRTWADDDRASDRHRRGFHIKPFGFRINELIAFLYI